MDVHPQRIIIALPSIEIIIPIFLLEISTSLLHLDICMIQIPQPIQDLLNPIQAGHTLRSTYQGVDMVLLDFLISRHRLLIRLEVSWDKLNCITILIP